jgi:predicted aldo/keto reductase-like oxidoreductase
MEYTQFGKTGLQVSPLGLGCMRFPKQEAEAVAMLRHAVDQGVNYLDTAYVYQNSELVTGKALRDGYREKVYLATKSPIWNITSHADFEKYLDEALLRLQTDHIDVYLLHNLNPENWDKVRKYDGLGFLDKMLQKGKIRYKGFSLHNTAAAFKEIADAFSWDMAQIQLNILGEEQQAGLEGLRYGAGKGLAMVVMEPLRGGSLLSNAPAAVHDLVAAYPEKRSLAEWCFRWLYDMREVSLILSGMSSLEQLEDNLRIFGQAGPGQMSERDQELIQTLRAAYEAVKSVGCTGCRYCMPCPQGVPIPELFALYNDFERMGRSFGNRLFYQRNFAGLGSGADKCLDCKRCTEHCPQRLDIPALLKEVHGALSK